MSTGNYEIPLDLLQRLKQHDRAAQLELYTRYSKAMYSICFRMLQDKEDAQDMLHDAFIEVYTKIGSFRSEAEIGAWIKKIVVNKCINKLNKKDLFSYDLDTYAEVTGEEEQDEAPVWSHLTVAQVKQATAQLADGFRMIFTLYAFENYSHGEIAGMTGISESTSKSQYKRAKEKLKEILLKGQNNEGR